VTREEAISDRHEAGGLTSQHDVEIFRAWKKALPSYTWNRARVDQYEGLTLSYDQDDDMTVELHFTNANCGYKGTSCLATQTILIEAGFGVGDPDAVWVDIYTNTHIEFTRSK